MHDKTIDMAAIIGRSRFIVALPGLSLLSFHRVSASSVPLFSVLVDYSEDQTCQYDADEDVGPGRGAVTFDA